MTPSLVSSLGFRRVASISPPVRVADVKANVREILRWAEKAADAGAEVIVAPELCITGYTLGDLVRFPDLLASALEGLDDIRQWSTGRTPILVVGLPMEIGGRLFNVAAVVQDAHVRALVPKTFLPSTNEYYEHRWFVSGRKAGRDTVTLGGVEVPFGTDLLIADPQDPNCVIGIEVCEDLWSVEPPSGQLALAGATLILNPSASNEIVSKSTYRRSLVTGQSARTLTAYVYASAGPTESTTDTVFSGHCMVAENGVLMAESEVLDLQGSMAMADVDLERCVTDRLHTNSFTDSHSDRSYRVVELVVERSVKHDVQRRISPMPFVPPEGPDRDDRCRDILRLQATGLAVRARHTGSKRFVIGVSGGLDSTLALLVCRRACDLLGLSHDHVLGISMPGMGTTDRTRKNAEALCRAVGAEFREISIDASVQQHFADIEHDPNDHSTVFENAQARERTQILMDVANKVGGIVVGTGDMSELALGWCTYNADQMSMYAVNAGVPKTLVRHLITWFADAIAEDEMRTVLHDIVDTPISPELLPPGASGEISQRTEDLIGPYEVQDFFLYHFVRMERSVRSIATLAMIAFQDRHTPAQILEWFQIFLTRFFQHQFKRSVMPDGVKIGSVVLSPRADWRMPSDAHPTSWLTELDAIRREIE